MKKNIIWGSVIALVASGCAHEGGSLTGPSPVSVNAVNQVQSTAPVTTTPTPTPVVTNPGESTPTLPTGCDNPRGKFIANLSADGKSIQVRNDSNCDLPVVFVAFSVPAYGSYDNQVKSEVIASTLKAHGDGGVITLTLTPKSGCYQTDFWFSMTSNDVDRGLNNSYPPFASKIVWNHGQPPIGCDPIVHYDPPTPPNPPDPPMCPVGQLPTIDNTHGGEPYCAPPVCQVNCTPNPPPPPPPPVDVCLNLPGLQISIPEGMIKNEAGECVNPPPPDPCVKPSSYGKIGAMFAPADPPKCGCEAKVYRLKPSFMPAPDPCKKD